MVTFPPIGRSQSSHHVFSTSSSMRVTESASGVHFGRSIYILEHCDTLFPTPSHFMLSWPPYPSLSFLMSLRYYVSTQDKLNTLCTLTIGLRYTWWYAGFSIASKAIRILPS